jgi:hypothetical protein
MTYRISEYTLSGAVLILDFGIRLTAKFILLKLGNKEFRGLIIA